MASQTVYIRNLEERIKIEDLKLALHGLFSEYGTILDIVAKRNLKAKGQAFVVFDDSESAKKAIEDIQGFELFDKAMRLEIAHMPSDAAIAKAQGPDALESQRKLRVLEKAQRQKTAEEEKRKRSSRSPDSNANKQLKANRNAGLKSSNPVAGTIIPEEYLPPNKVLFLQNIPQDYDVNNLSHIFARFDGFQELRLVPGRQGIAFVEYDSEAGATNAKEAVQGMELGESRKSLKVVYQRK